MSTEKIKKQEILTAVVKALTDEQLQAVAENLDLSENQIISKLSGRVEKEFIWEDIPNLPSFKPLKNRDRTPADLFFEELSKGNWIDIQKAKKQYGLRAINAIRRSWNEGRLAGRILVKEGKVKYLTPKAVFNGKPLNK